jgi:hypothetical protein
MVYVAADIGEHGCNVRPPIVLALLHDEHADGFAEFAYALGRLAELEFRAERNLEKAIDDFLVGEARPLQAAPQADVGVLGLCRWTGEHDGRGRRRGEDSTAHAR